MDFGSQEELENKLDFVLESIMDMIMEEAQEELDMLVLDRAYIEEEPLRYSRTWEFAEAMRFIRSDLIEYTRDLIFDEDKIITHDKMHHKIDSQDLYELLEGGYNVGGETPVSNIGHFVSKMIEWLNENFINLLIKNFKKFGIDLERS